MIEPVLTDEEAMRTLPPKVWQAILGLDCLVTDAGRALACEAAARRRAEDRPFCPVFQREYDFAKEHASRRLDVVKGAKGELARAILVALAEAKR